MPRNHRPDTHLLQVDRQNDRRRKRDTPYRDEAVHATSPATAPARQAQAIARHAMTSTLQTQQLTKSYGGRTVVRGVSIEVGSGEIVGLLGPNGAGKTTTFYMTVGLTGPDSGRAVLNGGDVTDAPMYVRARKGIGYLPQEPSIFRGLTVEQNILGILETLDLDRATRYQRLDELLAELHLTPLAKAPAHTLSGGERRRAEI